tara:strand:- start:1290 stop:1586 length:297 start_codon:yes stop_codon:yes gene_type:complete
MKLVRDRIPEIILKDGRNPIYHVATPEEFKRELFRKVIEELHEFQEDPCVEEAGDLLETVYALLDEHGHSLFDVLDACEQKFALVGGFAKGIVLEKVE